MPRQRIGEKKVTMNPNSLRNLKQNQNKTDDEFEQIASEFEFTNKAVIAMENEIEAEFRKYEQAYDLSEMMPNDVTTLRALIQAMLRLSKYEHQLNLIESKGISEANILMTEKISKVCMDLRASIAQMQDTLKISRKIRKSDKDQSVIAFLDGLKEKANKFYEAKMVYLLCPDDNNLLATVWFQNLSSKQNRIVAYCGRCKKEHTFKLWEIIENSKDTKKMNVPESIK